MNKFEYQFSGSAYANYPVLTFFALLRNGENDMEIPQTFPFCNGWGKPSELHISNEKLFMIPTKIDVVYLSIIEQKSYSAQFTLPYNTIRNLFLQKDTLTSKNIFKHVILGMTPYGGIAVWLYGKKKEMLVIWHKAQEISIPMSVLMSTKQNVTLQELCNYYINFNTKTKENLEKVGLPPHDLFDNYMKQFAFRYQVAFEKEKGYKGEKSNEDEAAPEFDYIEEALFDGTHDKLHDGGLMKYHEAGKPKKLKVQFHVGGETKDGKKRSVQEYSAYFWFEDERIREVFDRFYGAHPDTKTDFIIKIDAEKNKYQVALYRYGLKEPTVLSDDVYQLIVFRNKFECYRSENYNQQRGAWIW